ncbi:preprotein translocase subunit SecG [Candidatus Peregrinibacteria bacterium CG10_big_fil_rev_8_21_14_0_10_49_16]|nr:MAG: preprotein translocase subunit SecG [Candidatus Peregrinibacteria bacterium CG22_combo_CG10-13_8_21_14_all_49_11]PIR51895.1 MAG: preprotein translocase subunit SecG [Candidatus Peregrinibacteria bacterium CG10_big_fil_rev_8_21_14_0_10_49_16]
MSSLLAILQILSSVLLCFCILIQQRTSGLSAVFGGSGETLVVQRRGAEKVLFQATVALCALFFVLAVAQWYIF